MSMNPQVPIHSLAAWTLLLLWALFAGSELGEAAQLIEEMVTDAQGNHDLDEDTLLQLASVPKSVGHSPQAPKIVYVTTTAIIVTGLFPVCPLRLSYRLMSHPPPRLPLYQLLAVYRI